jgi:hypothetical protein
MSATSTVRIYGNLGADGSGNVYTASYDSLGYYGYRKTVCDTSDPGIHHLFVTNDEAAGATRSYSNQTNYDEDSITATQGTTLAVVTYWTGCGGGCGADEDHECFFSCRCEYLPSVG